LVPFFQTAARYSPPPKLFDRYIVDFYISELKTIIEVDGSQHFEPERQASDRERDTFFHKKGFRVLRYTNQEIDLQFENVCQDILNKTGLQIVKASPSGGEAVTEGD